MSNENSVSVMLSEKIEKLIEKYRKIEQQNEILKNEVFELREQNERLDEEILRLRDELKAKSVETDELLGKIESVLGI